MTCMSYCRLPHTHIELKGSHWGASEKACRCAVHGRIRHTPRYFFVLPSTPPLLHSPPLLLPDLLQLNIVARPYHGNGYPIQMSLLGRKTSPKPPNACHVFNHCPTVADACLACIWQRSVSCGSTHNSGLSNHCLSPARHCPRLIRFTTEQGRLHRLARNFRGSILRCLLV